MFVNLQSPLNNVIRNLALTGEPAQNNSDSSAVISQQSPSILGINDLVARFPTNPQSQFTQMFDNVIKLFKTFVGSMRDLGLISPDHATQGVDGTSDPSGTGCAQSDPTGQTTGTDGSKPADDTNPLTGIVDKILGPIKELFGPIGEKIASTVEKIISKPSSILNVVKNLFKKAKKMFTGKGSLNILTKAFGWIKSFL